MLLLNTRVWVLELKWCHWCRVNPCLLVACRPQDQRQAEQAAPFLADSTVAEYIDVSTPDKCYEFIFEGR